MCPDIHQEVLRDVAGYDLGAPQAMARPADAEEVRELVAWARRTRVPLVPFGRRTAYWRPLDFRGAVAVDLARIDHVAIDDGFVSIGAGALVRNADEALRARGFALPIVPDGFGDSSIGSMIATACTAGRGMGNGPLARYVTGLTVVDGSATILHTGTAAILALPPFLQDGLPDITHCFFGSEGCLGIVTEVHLRAVPPPHRVLLSFQMPVDRTDDLIDLGRTPLYDTFRATCEDGATWNAELWVQSHLSMDEALERAQSIANALDATPRPERGAPEWAGPIDGHEEFSRTRRLIGVDAIAPYARGATLAHQLLGMMAACTQAMHRRVAIYLSPEFVNAGLHLTYALGDEEGPLEAASFAGQLRDVVPYRFGRCWPVRDVDRTQLLRLKMMFDPDRILNPTHPLFAG